MRTTLTIDDDVLEAARALADQQNVPIGKVVSDMARRSMRRRPAGRVRNGVPLLASRPGESVTLEVVNALRDETP